MKDMPNLGHSVPCVKHCFATDKLCGNFLVHVIKRRGRGKSPTMTPHYQSAREVQTLVIPSGPDEVIVSSTPNFIPQ